MNEKKIITTAKAPKALGPYSVGVVAGNLVFTAGQLGVFPETGEPASDEIKGQTRQALLNISAILEAAGSGLQHVVKTTVFLRDMNDFAAMNEVYAEFFPTNCPARSAVQVAKLPKELAVEIETIAMVP
jgi:2-iminobutanoate/2-iminopropanoate deaminase